MEGIVTLIIIVVLYNLFSLLVRAAKGGNPSAGRKVLVTAENFFRDRDSEAEQLQSETEDYRDNDQLSGPDKIDFEKYDRHKGDSNEILELETKGKLVLEPEKKRISSTVSSSLQKVLSEEDPLVAAFIFHEILEPPPALRRKR